MTWSTQTLDLYNITSTNSGYLRHGQHKPWIFKTWSAQNLEIYDIVSTKPGSLRHGQHKTLIFTTWSAQNLDLHDMVSTKSGLELRVPLGNILKCNFTDYYNQLSLYRNHRPNQHTFTTTQAISTTGGAPSQQVVILSPLR